MPGRRQPQFAASVRQNGCPAGSSSTRHVSPGWSSGTVAPELDAAPLGRRDVVGLQIEVELLAAPVVRPGRRHVVRHLAEAEGRGVRSLEHRVLVLDREDVPAQQLRPEGRFHPGVGAVQGDHREGHCRRLSHGPHSPPPAAGPGLDKCDTRAAARSSSVTRVQEAPPELTEVEVLAVVRAAWDEAASRVEHLPVGFGAHHWRVDVDGSAGPVRHLRPLREAALPRLADGGVRGRDPAGRGTGWSSCSRRCRTRSGQVLVPVADGALSCTPWLDGRVVGEGPVGDRRDGRGQHRRSRPAARRRTARGAAQLGARWSGPTSGTG